MGKKNSLNLTDLDEFTPEDLKDSTINKSYLEAIRQNKTKKKVYTEDLNI